jgi:hypothetical protein
VASSGWRIGSFGQGLHPIGSIGWVAQIKQADKVVLEDLAVRWANQTRQWTSRDLRATSPA